MGVRAMADDVPFVSVDYKLSEQDVDLEVSRHLAEADDLWGLGVFEFRLAFPVRRARLPWTPLPPLPSVTPTLPLGQSHL